MISQIFSFLLALPKILGLVKDLFQMWKDMQRKSWEKEGQKIANKVQEATTDEERQNLAKELAKHTSSRP